VLRAILSFFGGIFSFAITAMLFVAVAIGGVFWMYSQDLPSHEQLANYAPPTISRIFSGEGQLIDEFALERRLFTPIDDIPDMVKHAFISAEDRNFYVHTGFDLRAMAVAGYEAVASRGQNVRGASTITQQVMKNFLLSGDRTGERKIKELILASRVEGTLTKDQILELYLNEIFLGQNSYGVTAAAQTYFNKTLDELDLHEVAFLAALPQAPSTFHPVRNRDRVIGRRNYVLGEMLRNGYITRAQHDAAREKPLLTVQSGDMPSPRENMPPRDYFTDEVRRQLSSVFGEDEFFTGGLAIRATIDPDMQIYAAHALQRALEQYDRGLGRLRTAGQTIDPALLADETAWRDALARMELARDITLGSRWFPAVVLDVNANTARLGIEGVGPDFHAPHVVERADINWARGSLSDNLNVGDVVYVRRVTADSDGSHIRWSLRQIPEVQGGFMAMDVNTGRVIAMQGGFSYQHSVFNRATQAQRQPGSAYKPFVYAAALDSGFTPSTIIIDAPVEIETPQGIWRPTNASNQFYGPTPIRRGLELSRNLMTIRLAQEVGMDIVGGYAERFRVYDRAQRYLAASLGSQETTLFRMVAAYAMFANGGERVEPTLVDRVQDRWGKTIYRHDQRNCVDCSDGALVPGRSPWITARRERVMDAVTAFQLTSMLQGAITHGTGRSVQLSVPVAGKTGTTNDARDVWFVGYTSNIVAGCYIGFDQPRPLGRGASGGSMCAPVFNEFMQQAVRRYGGGRFRVPEGGYFMKIDRNTGARLPDNASGANVVMEFFREGVEPIFGLAAIVDGGFRLGSDLPMFAPGDNYQQLQREDAGRGSTARSPASFGTVSTGGLY
jgi:penicillin-binding protein 1A